MRVTTDQMIALLLHHLGETTVERDQARQELAGIREEIVNLRADHERLRAQIEGDGIGVQALA